jgi:hypothetical protein
LNSLCGVASAKTWSKSIFVSNAGAPANVLRSDHAKPEPMQMLMAIAIESRFVTMTNARMVNKPRIGLTDCLGNSGVLLVSPVEKERGVE